MTLSIALQLYTLRQQAAEDFVGMLRAVAEAGYRAVEFAGFGGLPTRDLRALIDGLGIRAVSAHVPYRSLVDGTAAAIEDLTVLGCGHAVVPGIPPDLRGDADSPAVSRAFERAGAACRDAGIRFGYHNHGWEFEPRTGLTVFDRLAAATDPALVAFQLDVYWAMVAGADPVAWLRAHPGRVPTLHAKELAVGGEPSDTTVGDGQNDWPALIAAAEGAGTEWLIVEQEDDPDNAVRDIRRSFRNLTELVAGSGRPFTGARGAGKGGTS